MLKQKKNILILTITIAVLALVVAKLIKKDSNAIIEGKSGPYIEMGAQLNGLIKFDGDKVLISSRKQGLYTFDPINNWKKIRINTNIGEITSIIEFKGNIAILTKDNSLILFDKKSISGDKPIEVNTKQLSVSLQKIFKCEDQLIGISTEGIFEINNGEISKYKNSDFIPQTIDCHKDTMLVGTRASKIHSCSITKKVCEDFAAKTIFVDVRGILWSEPEQTWFASAYGSPSNRANVIKLVNNKWEPLNSSIGDVVGLYRNNKGQFRFALSESGFLYEYMGDNKLIKKDIKNILSPYYAEISPEKFYAISFGNLISYEKGITKNHGTPILLEQVDEKQRSGNTYIWDIEIVDENVAFSATSMIGVWWSSNGGTSWEPINKGLDDLKVHFIKYNKKHKTLIAGTHSKGLYTCGLPCKKWKYINDHRFENADMEDAVEIDENRYAFGSEHGSFIYNVGKEAIESYVPLLCKIQPSSDLWTTAKIGEDIFFGVYSGNECLHGVWKLNHNNKYEKILNLEETITAITYYNNFYYIGTLNSIYKCDNNSHCTKLHNLMINRMNLDDNILWIATSKGVGFLDLKKNDKEITWVLDIPSQVVKVLNRNKKLLLVGTLDSGVLRIRLK